MHFCDACRKQHRQQKKIAAAAKAVAATVDEIAEAIAAAECNYCQKLRHCLLTSSAAIRGYFGALLRKYHRHNEIIE